VAGSDHDTNRLSIELPGAKGSEQADPEDHRVQEVPVRLLSFSWLLGDTHPSESGSGSGSGEGDVRLHTELHANRSQQGTNMELKQQLTPAVPYWKVFSGLGWRFDAATTVSCLTIFAILGESVRA
jgi:hypothetical protein